MHCDHCVRRYERESVAVEAVCVVSLNYGECDTATRNCATKWSLRVTVTQLLKKRRHGNVPQCRPIEKIWALIEQMVYQGRWEAKNLDQLVNRIKSKVKQLDQTVVTNMVQGVQGKLLKMYGKSVYSTC